MQKMGRKQGLAFNILMEKTDIGLLLGEQILPMIMEREVQMVSAKK